MQVERTLLIDLKELAPDMIEALVSGERASNTFLIYPKDEDNYRDVAKPRYALQNENM